MRVSLYPEFKYLITSLATRYGEKGSDQLWMAHWQQVYEYIWLRDHVQTNVSQHGRNVIIKLLMPAIPAGFRYADIITSAKFTVYQSPQHTSDNGKTEHDLVNVSLK